MCQIIDLPNLKPYGAGYRTRLRRQALSFTIMAQIKKQHFSTPALKFFPVRISQHQLQRSFFFLTLPA